MAVKILEPVRTRFGAMVAEMSPRDRTLFLGLLVLGYLGAVGMTVWLTNTAVGDARSRVDAKEVALSRLQLLEAQYLENAGTVEQIENLLRENANQDFQAYVEKAAQKAGISGNLKAVREKGMTQDGTLQVKTFNVEVDKVSLQQLTDFLYAVEAGGFPLRINTSRIKASGQPAAKLVTATLEIHAYRLEEAAPLAPEGVAP